MTWTYDSKEVLDQALCLAVSEYIKNLIQLEGQPIYQSPRINEVLALVTEHFPDGEKIVHRIMIGYDARRG